METKLSLQIFEIVAMGCENGNAQPQTVPMIFATFRFVSSLYGHNVFCIPTHCSYIVKAFTKHVHGVDWEYHHSLGLINYIFFAQLALRCY